MKILFDNGTPNPLARSLTDHEVTFARKIGWHELKNGERRQKYDDPEHQLNHIIEIIRVADVASRQQIRAEGFYEQDA